MRITACILTLALGLVCATTAQAHAFPQNSSPHVGATLATAPTQVEIWFDGEIEPVFSTLLVKNAAGKQVSIGKGEVSSTNHVLLETALPKTLIAGTYSVYWSVIAHDGHHTAGHFAFTVK